MKRKYIAAPAFLLVLMFIMSCTAPQQTTTTTTTPPAPPATTIQPATPVQAAQGISSDVGELLAKSKTKVKNINYKYKGPQTADNFFDFYVERK